MNCSVCIVNVSEHVFGAEKSMAYLSGALVAAVDYDYALSVQLAGTHAITPGKLFDLSLRDCRNATPPDAGAFTCTVTDATAPDSSTVTGVTCVATLP